MLLQPEVVRTWKTLYMERSKHIIAVWVSLVVQSSDYCQPPLSIVLLPFPFPIPCFPVAQLEQFAEHRLPVISK